MICIILTSFILAQLLYHIDDFFRNTSNNKQCVITKEGSVNGELIVVGETNHNKKICINIFKVLRFITM